MKKRVLTWLTAVCMALTMLPLPTAWAAQTVTFSDVTDRNTAMAVETLRLMDVLDGYGDGTFRPEAILTRAQFCKMVVYAMGAEDELGLYRTVTVFPDVKPSHWAAGYINMAAKGKKEMCIRDRCAVCQGQPSGQCGGPGSSRGRRAGRVLGSPGGDRNLRYIQRGNQIRRGGRSGSLYAGADGKLLGVICW